jgi:ureidoacrylate peracid hydrolase
MPQISIIARPETISIDAARTAVIVIDMQNDFGSKGGLFDHAGIDISNLRRVIEPTTRVLSAARSAGIKIVYLKMGFRPDLSDLGAPDSPNRVRHLQFGVGSAVIAPDGRESRFLIRDTWNTDIVGELAPEPDDLVLYKNRFSGFYQTELDANLKRLGVKFLVFTGCTTSVCVESTVRDAMFRDYSPIILEDCVAEQLGSALPRSNHQASLLTMEALFGWVANSTAFVRALASGRSHVASPQ